MGATDFVEVIVGTDLARAYHDAVERAAWEYGHGGYTGTIAEKPGYVDLGPLPEGITYEELHARLTDMVRRDLATASPWVRKAWMVHREKWGPSLVVEVTGEAAEQIKARRGRADTSDRVWAAMGFASE